MGRPKLGRNAKTVPVTVKFSQTELDTLDSQRGGLSRSAYLRQRALTRGTPLPQQKAPRLPDPIPDSPVAEERAQAGPSRSVSTDTHRHTYDSVVSTAPCTICGTTRAQARG